TVYYMNRFLLILIAAFSIAFSASAQDVLLYGTLTDGDNKEPLVGASVIAENNVGVTTDLDGKYKLKLSKGPHTITYSYIGYESTVVKVDLSSGASVEKNLQLSMKSEQLDIVVVSSSQYKKSIAEETVSMEVVGKALIQNANATDLGGAIDKTPGVTIQDSQVSIRGGSSWSYGVGTRTAVMQDGVSMMSADLGEAQLRQAPLENVDQIEVIKGASSVVYGSAALNGVVNVITTWPKSAKPKTEVSVFQMLYDNPPKFNGTDILKWWSNEQVRGSSGASISHARKINKMDLVLGANFLKHQSFLQGADELRGGFNFKTRFHSKKKTGLNYGLNGNVVFEESGRFVLSKTPNELAFQVLQPGFDRYLRFNLDPHVHSTSENGFKHSLESRYMYIKRYGKFQGTKDAISHQVMANYQFQKLWKKWSITTGLPLNMGISENDVYYGVRLTYSGAIYAQGEFKHSWGSKRDSSRSWRPTLTAVAGFRYELFGVKLINDTLRDKELLKRENFFEPGRPIFRSGLNLQVAQGTFIRASAGQAYRFPSIAERFVSLPFAGIQIIPNALLKSEHGFSAEVGVKQAFRISKWMAYLDLAMYYQRYNNFIEYGFITADKSPELFVNQAPGTFVGLYPRNISNALVAGYELGFASMGQIGPIGVQALVGYTYNYPVNLDSVKNANGAKPYGKEFFTNMFVNIAQEDAGHLLKLRARHLVKGDVQFNYKKFGIGVTIIYGSYPENIPETETGAVNFIGSQFGDPTAIERYTAAHRKGDFVAHLRASYQLLKQLHVSFIVNNLTNRVYSTRPSKPEPIRNFTLKLRATF
ncbi:TonB-dependent receptor, partial [Bacteroidota bacterium]